MPRTFKDFQPVRALKLTGMIEALEQQQAQPQTHDLSFEQRLAMLPPDRLVLCVGWNMAATSHVARPPFPQNLWKTLWRKPRDGAC